VARRRHTGGWTPQWQGLLTCMLTPKSMPMQCWLLLRVHCGSAGLCCARACMFAQNLACSHLSLDVRISWCEKPWTQHRLALLLFPRVTHSSTLQAGVVAHCIVLQRVCMEQLMLYAPDYLIMCRQCALQSDCLVETLHALVLLGESTVHCAAPQTPAHHTMQVCCLHDV
jgi:hypothetical protein